ncbi:hypothetical protein M9Y10_025410 [Tritrichomonas musculus]|uniref:Transmembrane protein n=1 Tax=Tritrichomonas musculus TaxID=1915356 RepID=A0ABR2H9M7_9EUKA
MMLKDRKTLKNQILFKCQLIIDWFRAGDLPPKTHYKSLCLMIVLLILGTILGICFVLSHFEIALTDVIPVAWPFFGLSCITLLPSLYIFFVSICCWRRVKGYGWWMIPYVEDFW